MHYVGAVYKSGTDRIRCISASERGYQWIASEYVQPGTMASNPNTHEQMLSFGWELEYISKESSFDNIYLRLKKE